MSIRIEMHGRLTKDPELKHVGASSYAILNFSVVCDSIIKKEIKPTWTDWVAYGNLAEEFAEMAKGNEVHIIGTAVTETYESKQSGKEVSRLKWVAQSIQCPGISRNQPKGNRATKPEPAAEKQEVPEDDVPF